MEGNWNGGGEAMPQSLLTVVNLVPVPLGTPLYQFPVSVSMRLFIGGRNDGGAGPSHQFFPNFSTNNDSQLLVSTTKNICLSSVCILSCILSPHYRTPHRRRIQQEYCNEAPLGLPGTPYRII